MSDAEVKEMAAGLTLHDLHQVLLAMIDARMSVDDRAPAAGRELTALADAGVAYEEIMFPLEA